VCITVLKSLLVWFPTRQQSHISSVVYVWIEILAMAFQCGLVFQLDRTYQFEMIQPTNTLHMRF